ncbi:hypothetical protein CNR27_01145 [Luteimonas chenhongjianii]|uniref:Uncharacterized protein n=2 Tax=Luteimonas chenhongjianii TaxID=2006110 RepID=A0A290XBB0_9GAMM|nr:hypothetical protein CNR27_01145 [Luteimonas chenhongjianii]
MFKREVPMESLLISDLRRQRRRLLQSYAVHVMWFTAMVATAVIHASPRTIAIATMLALITVPPVIAYAAAVHTACRAIDPGARTIGLVPMIIMTVIFTPFESGLIVPAKNLFVSAKLLERAQHAALGPDNSFKTTQRRGAAQFKHRVLDAASKQNS